MTTKNQIKNARRWVISPWPERLIVTLTMIAIVLTVRYILHPYLQDRLAFQPFFIAAQLIAFFYGYQYAVFALFMGALLGSYFFVSPYNQFSWPNGEDAMRISAYFLASFLAIGLIEYLQRNRYATRLLLMMAQSRYNCLLRLDKHRLYLQRRAVRASLELSEIFENFPNILLLILPNGQFCVQPKLLTLTNQTALNSLDEFLSLIDPKDHKKITRLLEEAPRGHFLKHSAPLRFIDAHQQLTWLDCILQTVPLNAQKSALALRLGKRGQARAADHDE